MEKILCSLADVTRGLSELRRDLKQDVGDLKQDVSQHGKLNRLKIKWLDIMP